TPLHLTAIKGDVETVKELLDQGADPNLKDNAGWTPLHEVYNLGHQCVVEVLVRRGVLLNTPGNENDSPLLNTGLLEYVWSLSCGLCCELRQSFSQPLKDPNSPLSPPPNLSKSIVFQVSDGVRWKEQVVVLGSKLSQSQHNQLAKLGIPLGGKRANAFSCSVTHVVVPDRPMPTTLFSLLGLLNGCWVLNFSW
uniref:BRCT domain-containing protein n=1 Tax=Hucho hucho TaxID=62062 RepID=A0A4W5JNK7_9TELE